MQKYKDKLVKFTIYLPEDSVKLINARAAQTNESSSSLIRHILTQALSQESVTNNIDTVSNIIRRVVRDITRAETDRLAKLIVKTMKASAAGMYLFAQVAHKTTELDGNTELDDAMSKAVNYIKTAYSEETEHEPIKAKPIQDEMSKRAQAFKNEDDLLDELLSEM